jgi:hypothetical protein
MTIRAGLMALALAATPLSAQAGLSEADRAILEAFYAAANGGEWTNNSGWLEPGSDACSWYGVTCGGRFGVEHDVVKSLDLSANNVSGTLDTAIFQIVLDTLDLSDNAIGGTLDEFPASPGRVDLSNNHLTGQLPTSTSDPAQYFNWYLDLSGNDFEGQVPEDWDPPKWLSLANNRLEGVPENLLQGVGAGNPTQDRFLDLSDNAFSGALPTSMMEAGFLPNGSGGWGGGINLCWNDWSIPESVDFRDWLRDHHVGGDYEPCLSRERMPFEADLSGSWYDPSRSGEGISVHQLDSGASLIYFFTFDENGEQQWLFDVQPAGENHVRWREMLRTRGRFGEGLLDTEEPAVEVRGSFRIDQLDNGNLLAERVYIGDTDLPCLAVYPPPLGCFGPSISDRLEYRRLSRVSGATCEDQSGFQAYSGAWYNPERSGEGFVVEVLANDRAVVYWFTYTPDGSGDQAWMIGEGVVGSFDAIDDGPPPGQPESRIEIDSVWQPVGASFGPDFDPADVQLVDWGRLVVDFYRDGSGRVEWNSKLDGFGSGSYDLQRLARPKLANCD